MILLVHQLLGLLVFAGQLLGLLFRLRQTRVELFAVECQEEKSRLVQALLLTAAAIAAGTMTLMLVTITVLLTLVKPLW